MNDQEHDLLTRIRVSIELQIGLNRMLNSEIENLQKLKKLYEEFKSTVKQG